MKVTSLAFRQSEGVHAALSMAPATPHLQSHTKQRGGLYQLPGTAHTLSHRIHKTSTMSFPYYYRNRRSESGL